MLTRMPRFGGAERRAAGRGARGRRPRSSRCPTPDVRRDPAAGQVGRPVPRRRDGARVHQVPHLQGDRGRGHPGDRHDRHDPPAPPRLVPPLRRQPARVPPRHPDADRLARRQVDAPEGARRRHGRGRSRRSGSSSPTAPPPPSPTAWAASRCRCSSRTRPVIYRNFIQGAGPRAIGVGYPEKANLAFDANDLRIALIWQGGFMDASRHWTGRGEGFQPPMGDNVVALPAGAPFATLPSHDRPLAVAAVARPRLPLPRLPAGQGPPPDVPLRLRPDPRRGPAPRPSPARRPPGLKRTLTLTSDAPADDLYFRVGGRRLGQAAGRRLVPGQRRVEGPRSRPAAEPVVRPSGRQGRAARPGQVRRQDGDGRRTVRVVSREPTPTVETGADPMPRLRALTLTAALLALAVPRPPSAAEPPKAEGGGLLRDHDAADPRRRRARSRRAWRCCRATSSRPRPAGATST